MTVNALKIRQSFGAILKQVQASNEPLIIEKGRVPVAVIISLKTYKERFIDLREKEKKDELFESFVASGTKTEKNSMKVLRELRYGSHR